jgi:hypothetical protein
VDPVPDPLLFFSESARESNPGPLDLYSRTLTTRPQRRSTTNHKIAIRWQTKPQRSLPATSKVTGLLFQAEAEFCSPYGDETAGTVGCTRPCILQVSDSSLQLFPVKFFAVFLSLSSQITKYYLKLDHETFLAQFSISLLH